MVFKDTGAFFVALSHSFPIKRQAMAIDGMVTYRGRWM